MARPPGTDPYTTVRLRRTTKARLLTMGAMGDTMDRVILRLIEAVESHRP